MVRFKLKMNQNELKAVAAACSATPQLIEKPKNAAALSVVETCERLWSRLRNIYRPDRDKYSIRLGATEVHILTEVMIPIMKDQEEPLVRSIGYAMDEELRKQIEREINIYNAMCYGDA